MRDVAEKYARLNLDFPNKAGKLESVLATQKRLVNNLSTKQQSEELKALLLSVSEGYDVAKDLMQYMKNVLQGVALDAEALLPGSVVRNTVKDQNEFIELLTASRNESARTNKKPA